MGGVSSAGAKCGGGLVLKMLEMREVRDMALLDWSGRDSYDVNDCRVILRISALRRSKSRGYGNTFVCCESGVAITLT